MLTALLDILKRTLDERPIRLLAGVAAVLAGLTWGAFQLYQAWWQPEQLLITAAQAHIALQKKMDEYGRHLGEGFEAFTLKQQDGNTLVVRVYGDWCAYLVRTVVGRPTRGSLVVDLARDDHAVQTRGVLPAVLASDPGQCPGHPPGPFAHRWWGERSGPCLARQYWLWHDGCILTQWIDVCDGTTAGAPYWTVCRH